jgi:hypothetical protein
MLPRQVEKGATDNEGLSCSVVHLQHTPTGFLPFHRSFSCNFQASRNLSHLQPRRIPCSARTPQEKRGVAQREKDPSPDSNFDLEDKQGCLSLSPGASGGHLSMRGRVTVNHISADPAASDIWRRHIIPGGLDVSALAERAHALQGSPLRELIL